jgi:hypothetical protein
MERVLNDAIDGPLRKLTNAELRKGWTPQEELAERQRLLAMLAEAQEIAARRRAAFPAFRQWACS